MTEDRDFLLDCAKQLTIRISGTNDRILAAAWIRRLETDTKTSKKVLELYVKALIFSLQKKAGLRGPFASHPNNFPDLPDIPVYQKVFELNRQTTESNKNPAEFFECDFSGDFCTYVAVQPMRNLGIHCYYAISNRPVQEWDRFDREMLPEKQPKPAEIIGGLKTPPVPPTPPPTPLDPLKIAEDLKKDQEQAEKINEMAVKLTKKAEKIRNELQVHFIGKPGPSSSCQEDTPRAPPSWGSNLLLVRGLDFDCDDEDEDEDEED